MSKIKRWEKFINERYTINSLSNDLVLLNAKSRFGGNLFMIYNIKEKIQ